MYSEMFPAQMYPQQRHLMGKTRTELGAVDLSSDVPPW